MKRIAMIAGGLLAAQAAFAGRLRRDWSIHNITTDTTQLKQKIYVQSGDGRFVDAEGRSSLIKGDTLYMIDDTDKSYIVFDKATMEQLAKKLSEADGHSMQEQMAKLPPEQRAQMEQMMGGAGLNGTASGPWTSPTPASPTRSMAAAARSGTSRATACSMSRSAWCRTRRCPARRTSPGGVHEFREGLRGNGEIRPHVVRHDGQRIQCHVKTNGYPVRHRAYENGKLVDEETLVKVWREETIPASMFEIPAGYTREADAGGTGAVNGAR